MAARLLHTVTRPKVRTATAKNAAAKIHHPISARVAKLSCHLPTSYAAVGAAIAKHTTKIAA